MITLQTGLPGSGKTLYTIATVKALSEKDNRPVFYSGITDLAIPEWTEIDAEKWYECPANSLIVIDECQRVFRPRTISKEVPLYVSELETHRHKGLDLWMITQHPMLADMALRRLSGKHIHAIRPFGFQGVSLHEWPSVKDTCDKSSGRVDSIKTKWGYDKSIFKLYKSAELHTVKRAIPMKLKLAMMLPVLLVGAGYYYWNSVQKRIHPDALIAVPGVPGAVQSQPAGGKGKASYLDAKADAQQYLFDRTPRISNWDASQPRYDDLTKPVRVPMPVACVKSRRGCSCYSQQATPVNVTEASCLAIVDKGYFMEFDPEGGREAQGGRIRGDGASRNDPVPAQDTRRIYASDTEPMRSPAPSRGRGSLAGQAAGGVTEGTRNIRSAPSKGQLSDGDTPLSIVSGLGASGG